MRRLVQALSLLALALALGAGRIARAQATTRLLLSSGTGVPGHAGFVYGPFSSLAMNKAKDIVFLTSLRSARIELRAVARSTGVSFSVIAFQGLRAPVPRATYESFSAPSLNDAGDIVFTAQLKDESPSSAVVRMRNGTSTAIVTSGDAVPGMPETTFEEFSAPLVSSAGNVLFSARTGGKTPGMGLFLWTSAGIRVLAIPTSMNGAPNDLLEPAYFSHDEAVFAARSASPDALVEQFFRAVAIKSFQELNPAPALSDIFELLPVRSGDAPAKMLLALIEGDSVQTVPLVGDPSQAVMAKRQAGLPSKALGRILGQTVGTREELVFAATSGSQENDLGFYCYCDGQVSRLTSQEEFLPIVQGVGGKAVISLSSDLQQTAAFIVSRGSGGDAIYVTSLP